MVLWFKLAPLLPTESSNGKNRNSIMFFQAKIKKKSVYISSKSTFLFSKINI